MPRRVILGGLVLLVVSVACGDTSCGGCVEPPAEPFPTAPRVYDGVQMRITQSGLVFIEDNLPDILATLIQDGLTFEIPRQDTGILGVVLCDTPCSVTIEIVDANLTLVPPNTVVFDGHVNVNGEVNMVAPLMLPCAFPLLIQNKSISVPIALLVDSSSGFFCFEIGDLDVTIEDDDYDIVCGPAWDFILDNPTIKPFLTGVINFAMGAAMGGAIDGIVADQTCAACDFYTAGCPASHPCDSNDNFCKSGDDCLRKPLGIIGTLDLGQQLESIDPTNDAAVDMLIALGQARQPNQHPFVRNNGLEVRMIGGTYSDQDECVPTPAPTDIPPVGEAQTLFFGNTIPGIGGTYMVGVAIADMYLDHLFYQFWRSGLLCLSIDSYGIEQISSKTLALFLPSLDLVTDGENLPVRMTLRPEGVPYMEVGAGTFDQDGNMLEPILYMFLPDFGMDFWMNMQGRWIRFLSLMQDVEVRLGLQFTAENQVIPVLDENSVIVTNAQATNYELLAEDTTTLEGTVPQLIGMFLPMLTETMGEIAIPDLQGFILDVQSVQGDVRRQGTDYYEFMSIYAGLDFAPPPPPADTRVLLGPVTPDGFQLELQDADLEIQYRLDNGYWSPFRRGPVVEVFRRLLPGRHELEIRAREIGRYRTLDPTPLCLAFEIDAP
jgi:hypothetical protein